MSHEASTLRQVAPNATNDAGRQDDPLTVFGAIDRSPPRRGVGWKGLALAVVVGAVLVTAGAYWFIGSRPVPVRVELIGAAAPDQAGTGLETTGYAVAEETATVSADRTGRIIDLFVDVGDRVAAGAVVARLDDREDRILLDRLKTDMAARIANRDAMVAELALARTKVVRAAALLDHNAITQSAHDERVSEATVLEARQRALEQEILSDRQRIALQEHVLSQHVIRAPFSGIVTVVNARVGEIVSPSSAGGTFTRSGVCTIMNPESIRLHFEVSERFIHRVDVGDRLQVSFAARPGLVVDARVTRIAPTANDQTGAVTVIARPVDDRIEVKPGLRATARFHDEDKPVDIPPTVVSLPRSAVHSEGGADYVFIVEQDRTRRIQVTGQLTGDGRYQLDQPWPRAMPVVVWAGQALTDNAIVKVR